ncbi:hypothetical protein PG985_011431 [Apiospora marii]|uniref:Zn(2)-C6 fungal-type domain-containing protein n=1 Tax=Apiospora marii TaxID=335849 RepID=A0ABR1STQ5_9PEZI
MVGVPRSDRCLTCAKRKVKCDETWPTCGACKRSKKVCPGPPSSKLKFVHNGHHTVTAYDNGEGDATANKTKQVGNDGAANARTDIQSLGSLVETKLTKADDGRSFRRLRLKPAPLPPPRLVRLGNGDRAAAQLISISRACPNTGFDVCLGWGMDYLHMMTQCMSHSVVLQDAVGAMFDYDLHSVTNSAKHAAGLATIMTMRGPPKSHDSVDLMLGMQNFLALAMGLAGKGNGLAEIHRWTEALRQCAKFMGDDPMGGFLIRLLCQAAQWPCVVSLKGRLRQTIGDHITQKSTEIASDILNRLEAAMAELRLLDAEMILPAMRDGNISLVPSPPTGTGEAHSLPFQEHYEFRDWDLSIFFRLHAWCLIAMNRMLHDVYRLLGQDPASSHCQVNEEEARFMSRRIWLSHEHAMRHWPLGSTQTLAQIILSYEAGDDVERAFVLRALRDLNRHRPVSGTSVDDVWTEATVLYASMQITGRNFEPTSLK